jgi:hypothetical protein
MYIQGENMWHWRCKTWKMYNIHWLSFNHLNFIYTHVFVKKVNVTQAVHTHRKARVVTNFIQSKQVQRNKWSFPYQICGGIKGEQRYSSTLTSALDGCQWLTSHPAQFNPGTITRYHFREEKNFCPYYSSNPEPTRWWNRYCTHHDTLAPKISP